MKKILTLLAVGSIAFGVVSAAAARLGNDNPQSIGAMSSIVTSCGTAALSYTTAYSATNSEYNVTEVKLTFAAANTCGGEPMSWKFIGGTDGTYLTATLPAGIATSFTATTDAVTGLTRGADGSNIEGNFAYARAGTNFADAGTTITFSPKSGTFLPVSSYNGVAIMIGS